MIQTRQAEFLTDLSRTRDLIGLGQSIGAMTSGVVDASDVYRAALTQSVAALDALFHGVVEDRLVDIVMGRLPAPEKSEKFGLTPGQVAAVMSEPTEALLESRARSFVAQRLASETFQTPDQIGAALAAAGVPKVWKRAFSDTEAVRRNLRLIVVRRNQIVHQCDRDKLRRAVVLPLDADDALYAVATVESTGLAILSLC